MVFKALRLDEIIMIGSIEMERRTVIQELNSSRKEGK